MSILHARPLRGYRTPRSAKHAAVLGRTQRDLYCAMKPSAVPAATWAELYDAIIAAFAVGNLDECVEASAA